MSLFKKKTRPRKTTKKAYQGKRTKKQGGISKTGVKTKGKKSGKKPVNKTLVMKSQVKKSNGKRKKARHTLSNKQLVRIPTNKQPNLVKEKVISPKAFLSSTGPTFNEIYALKQHGKLANEYEIAKKPRRYSTGLKLILDVTQSEELLDLWTVKLWDILQSQKLDKDIDVTVVRTLEKRDSESMLRIIKNRRRLSIIGSDDPDKMSSKKATIQHDYDLLWALNSADSVMGFSAEAWITAPSERKLEDAVSVIQDHIKTSEALKGLSFSLDINKQDRPLILYGPNNNAGNKDIYMEMAGRTEATRAGLVVDAGGDRVTGSEYVGLSVGKIIQNHAAYSFQHPRSIYVGNDTRTDEGTYTMDRHANIKDQSQIYLSKVASRSYLLAGKQVLHIVADEPENAKDLMTFKLFDYNKQMVDVSKGLLNIIEPMKTKGSEQLSPERLVARFATHVNNVIILLSQFKEDQTLTTTDAFADILRQIFTDFMVDRKVWSYDAIRNVDQIRLFVQHKHFPRLYEFGSYIDQRLAANRDNEKIKLALDELDSIVNKNILPTIPALNTYTDPIIDTLVRVPYKVIDLTGTSEGAISAINNPSMNVMAIAYLNALLPSLNNGDAVFLHGLSQLSAIGKVITDIINSSGLNLNIVFTEKNQTNADRLLGIDLDTPDLILVDLYENPVSNLIEPFNMNAKSVEQMRQVKGSFFIHNRSGEDYFYLDHIL